MAPEPRSCPDSTSAPSSPPIPESGAAPFPELDPQAASETSAPRDGTASVKVVKKTARGRHDVAVRTTASVQSAPVRRRLACVLLLASSWACHKSEAGEAPVPPASATPATSTSSSTPTPTPPAPTCAPLTFDLPPPVTIDGLDPAPVDVEDPHGALERYFERTAALLRKGAKDPVRIGVYADSNGTMDFMTGEMRRVLQTSHGDAGHGYVALARPWNWYRHQYVVSDYDDKAWTAYTVTTHPTPAMDPWYGHAMIVAQSKQSGARTWVETAPDTAPIGTHASRLEVWYLKYPAGGAFDVKVDGEVKATADTHAEGEPHFGFVRVDVPDGPHKMVAVTKIRTRRASWARCSSATSAPRAASRSTASAWGRSTACACCARARTSTTRFFAHRPYDLVIFHIGSNTWNPAVMDPVACMKELIARLRRAVPDVSVMVMTPADWGEKGANKTPGWLKKVEAQLRQAADESGAAFYDFRSAMGGEGSMAKFLGMNLTQGDGVHFNQKGGAFVGDRVVAALGRAFAVWAKTHPQAGCEPGDAAAQ